MFARFYNHMVRVPKALSHRCHARLSQAMYTQALKDITSPELVPSSCMRQHTQEVLAQRVLPSLNNFLQECSRPKDFYLFLFLLSFHSFELCADTFNRLPCSCHRRVIFDDMECHFHRVKNKELTKFFGKMGYDWGGNFSSTHSIYLQDLIDRFKLSQCLWESLLDQRHLAVIMW